RIGLLLEGDRMLLPIPKAPDDNTWQSVLAFEPHEEVFENSNIEDEPARPMRDEIAPILAAWAVERRLHDLKVFRATFVGPYNEAVHIGLHVIFMRRLARSYQPQSPAGRRKIE